jgi:ABC-type branched-subunit amino acid transport system substrate-binding protein
MPAYDWWSYDAVTMIAQAIEEHCAAPDEVVNAIEAIGSFELVGIYSDLGATHEFHSPDSLTVATLQADGTIDYGS